MLALFSSVLAAQGQLTGLSLSLLDSNGTAAAEGEVPASLVIGFTTTAANAATATVTLPSGMLSDGTMSFPARRLQEDPDEADWSGRVLATPTCEPYGTATVSSNVLTFSVRKVGTASDPCDAGATLSTTLTGNTASFSSPATGALAFTVATDTDSVPVSVTVIVDNTGTYTLSVVGDPITWYGGKKIKFWFPPQKLLPLMTTPEMTIWASTFQGPTIDYQWFDRFVVTDLEGHELVDVSVRRASADSNRSDFRIGDFKQLNIRMAGKLLRRRSSQLFSGGRDVKVGVGSRVVDPPRVHHSRLLEFVLVESDSISFMVHAAHAGAEFPGDFQKQVDNTHLDWINLEMVKSSHFSGILPQIWGLEPRTSEVEAMLIAPSKQTTVCSAVE